MAKSKLRGNRNTPPKENEEAVVVQLDSPILYISNGSRIRNEIDLRDFGRRNCDASGAVVTDRSSHISTLIKNCLRYLKDQGNETTLCNQLDRLKSFIRFADRINLPAFSFSALEAYHCDLWSQVDIFNARKRFIFQCKDGEKRGLKERSANTMWHDLNNALALANLSFYDQVGSLRRFGHGDQESWSAYSKEERTEILSKLQDYFFGLSAPLLACNDATPPEIIDVCVSGTDLLIEPFYPKSDERGDRFTYTSPFNQAMITGYYLLSYYSAFNTSQLLEICHPLEVEKDHGTSARWYTLRGVKRRADGITVEAQVGGEVMEGDIAKSGLKFIETLELLSRKYSDKHYGPLLYTLSEKGAQHTLNPGKALRTNPAFKLFITSSTQNLVADHIIRCVYTAIKKNEKSTWKERTEDGGIVIDVTTTTLPQPAKYISNLIFAGLQSIAMETVNLKGALRGIKVADISGNKIDIQFNREDGTSGRFTCKAKYRQFIEQIERYSEKANPPVRYPSLVVRNRTPYLITFGSTARGFWQWEGFAPDGLEYKLNDIGISHGDYYVNLNASRLRETNATIAKNSGKDDVDVAKILSNSLASALKYYSEGNHDENRMIMSEGLLVLEAIASGDSLQDAKDKVAKVNQIDVLTIDDVSARKGAVNAAGFFCDKKGERPAAHTKTARAAAKLGMSKEKLPCFQYDECIDCASAKLVDEVNSVYRQLSLIDCLEQGKTYFPESKASFLSLSQRLLSLIRSNISTDVFDQAIELLLNEGRHPLYEDIQSNAALFTGRD